VWFKRERYAENADNSWAVWLLTRDRASLPTKLLSLIRVGAWLDLPNIIFCPLTTLHNCSFDKKKEKKKLQILGFFIFFSSLLQLLSWFLQPFFPQLF
jgi:hypothetical protein